MRTQEIVEAYGKTHIYMIGMDDNPQPKHIDVIIKKCQTRQQSSPEGSGITKL